MMINEGWGTQGTTWAVLWCCGAVVLWCYGAMVLWCCGAVVLWCQVLDARCCVLNARF